MILVLGVRLTTWPDGFSTPIWRYLGLLNEMFTPLAEAAPMLTENMPSGENSASWVSVKSWFPADMLSHIEKVRLVEVLMLFPEESCS